MVTSKDVAARAGVAQSTVSYVMSGSRAISPETRQKVEDAMRDLGYQPNASARALKSQRTNVLGLVVHFSADTELEGVLPFVETVTATAREYDYDVVLMTADEGRAGIERLARRGIVDAFVVMDVTRDDDRIPSLRELGRPTVFIGQPDDREGLNVVDFDGGEAGGLAVRELARAGCTDVLLVSDPGTGVPPTLRFIAEFHDGARAAAEGAGLDLRIVSPDGLGWQSLAIVVEEGLPASAGRPGIVTRTPQMTQRVEQILVESGRVPGKDVLLVGGCEDDFAASLRVPVTNFSSQPRELSRLAVTTLFAQLRGEAGLPELQLVSPRLTRRATT